MNHLAFTTTLFLISAALSLRNASCDLRLFKQSGIHASPGQENTVPRYLLELYRKRHYPSMRNKGITVTAFFLEGEIRQITPRGTLELVFVLPAMSSKNLVKAELRVLKKRATESAPLRCEYSVMVHSIVSGEKTTETFIDSLRVKNSLKGQWLEFNVAATLRMTTHDPENKLVFMLSTDHVACSAFQIGKKGRHRPFLVTYTRDKGGESSQEILSRITSGSKQVQIQPVSTSRTNKMHKDRKSRAIKESYCRPRRYRVHFRALKWNSWIIAPRSYWANYCDGTCPRVLVHPIDASNHAILQSILRQHASYADVPNVSCVPTQLRSISILFRNWKDNSIMLKEFPDMTVSACGCR